MSLDLPNLARDGDLLRRRQNGPLFDHRRRSQQCGAHEVRESSPASSTVAIRQPLALQTASHRLQGAGCSVVPPSAGDTPNCGENIECAICQDPHDTAKRMVFHI